MKKIFINISAILLSLVSLYSCQEIFDYNDDGRVTYDQVFSDYSLSGKYMNSCYAYLPWWRTFIRSKFTDEAQDANATIGLGATGYYEGQMSSQNNYVDGTSYDSFYKGIRKCNTFLENIDKLQYYSVPENKSRWLGEIHVLRAYYAFELIKRYGPLPIPYKTLNQNYDFASLTRPSYYECVQDILKDIDEGLTEPSFKWRVTSSAYNGSITKAMAYALKSEVILFAASPQWTGNENHWDEAVTICKQAIDSLEAHNYGIFKPSTPNYKGVYSEYQDFFLTAPELVSLPKTNVESIWGVKSNMNGIWSDFGLPMRKGDGVTASGLHPVQELVDAYPTLNGEPILNLSKPYLDEDHLEPNYNTANTQYDPKNPYANRDPRLFSTIYCNGNNYDLTNISDPVWTYVGGNNEISETNELYTSTGYYMRKYINWTSGKNNEADGYLARFRMGEVYLNYAEALFEANKAVTDEVVKYASITRERVGLPAFSTSLTPDEFELELRNERRIELAFEDMRYYDLRRWKINSDYEGVVTGMKITQDTSDPTKFTYTRIKVQQRNVTDSKYNLLPIPRTEQLKFAREGVENYQNPGW